MPLTALALAYTARAFRSNFIRGPYLK